MFGKKEQRLTCKRCGHVSYRPIPKKKTPPNRAMIAGANLQAAGSRMSVFSGGANKGGTEYQAERLQQQRDRIMAERHPQCSSCGSQSLQIETVKAA